MRRGVDGLCSPRPLIDTMPFVYQTDPLAEQLCAAFDDVLAPIFATLDCLPAYLDAKTTPEDMLDWLARWIGLTINGHPEPTRKRELISAGAALLPWRGTVRSVHEAVVAAFNHETEVIESGSATWSTTPNSKPGGQPVPSLIVRVTVDRADDIDQRSLDALVESVKPAHIPHRVETVVRVQQPSDEVANASRDGAEARADGADASADDQTLADGVDATEEVPESGDGADASGDGADTSEDLTMVIRQLGDEAPEDEADSPDGGDAPPSED